MEDAVRRDRGHAKLSGRRCVEEDALRAIDAVVHWPADVLTVNAHLHVVGLVPFGRLIGIVLEDDALNGNAAKIAVP